MTRSKTFFRIRRIRAMYRARFGCEREHLAEMARDLDVSVKSLGEMLDYLEIHDMSIDSDWARDDDARAGLHDSVASGDPDPEDLAVMSQDRSRMRYLVGRAMQCLDEREKLVASARLMQEEPRTLADLGKSMGVSRERARQIEVRAREKLGRALMREGLSRTNLHSVLAH
jgi:RNA polymerase sigma-32 factor